MGGFVKVYGTILDSSIWAESAETRLLWVTLLAMADANGIVRSSVSGLAHRARISREGCEAGLAILQAPDPESLTPDNEGRRIERTEAGWLILNHRKYREMRTDEQVKTAERVRKHRAGEDSEAATVTGNACNADPVTCNAGNAVKRLEEEAEAEEEEKKEKEQGARALPPLAFPIFPTKDAPYRWTLTAEQARKWEHTYPHLDVDLALRKAWGAMDADPAKRYSTRGMAVGLNNWLSREFGCRRELPAAREAAKARDEATALDLARRTLTARAFAASENGTISAADRERIVTEAEAATSREALEAIRWP